MLKHSALLRSPRAAALVGLVAVSAPTAAAAHFLMMEPTSAIVQDQRGDPQKLGPCGGTTANGGTQSNAVTAVRGGDMLHLKIKETVFHPGHYRVALAVNDRAELPADPETVTRATDRGPYSVSAKIDAKPRPPVLADGLFRHTVRLAPGLLWETDIRVPNINCDNCTLQVIQWMAEHGFNTDGGYSYHHCATLKITANPRVPIDRRWPQQQRPRRRS
jgi:hypothetical protein